MKHFILLITLMFSVTANAAQLNIQGKLTPEQKAQVILYAEQMAGPGDPPKAEQVKEWVDVGTAIGEGLAGAAGELGVEVNKFADTFVGKLTMFVIVWHYMGQDVVGILFGIGVWMFGIPTWIWMYRTRGSQRVHSVEEFDKGEGPNGVRKVITYTSTSAEVKGFYLGVLGLLIAIGTLPVVF